MSTTTNNNELVGTSTTIELENLIDTSGIIVTYRYDGTRSWTFSIDRVGCRNRNNVTMPNTKFVVDARESGEMSKTVSSYYTSDIHDALAVMYGMLFDACVEGTKCFFGEHQLRHPITNVQTLIDIMWSPLEQHAKIIIHVNGELFTKYINADVKYASVRDARVEANQSACVVQEQHDADESAFPKRADAVRSAMAMMSGFDFITKINDDELEVMESFIRRVNDMNVLAG